MLVHWARFPFRDGHLIWRKGSTVILSLPFPMPRTLHNFNESFIASPFSLELCLFVSVSFFFVLDLFIISRRFGDGHAVLVQEKMCAFASQMDTNGRIKRKCLVECCAVSSLFLLIKEQLRHQKTFLPLGPQKGLECKMEKNG